VVLIALEFIVISFRLTAMPGFADELIVGSGSFSDIAREVTLSTRTREGMRERRPVESGLQLKLEGQGEVEKAVTPMSATPCMLPATDSF
jgi:hypothetical protein